MTALGPAGVDLGLRVWVKDADQATALKGELLEAITKRFETADVARPQSTWRVQVEEHAP